MPKCGDCNNFQPVGANPAANTGLCVALLDEDGLPKPTDLYADASECPKFDAMDRIRTKTSEFMGDHYLRIARGFDER
ncbi:MAG: hypothetical protein SVP26_01615 [Chloroflexota bacterium]|nr:hypothetical protein [Chloroflexota bacterium]